MPGISRAAVPSTSSLVATPTARGRRLNNPWIAFGTITVWLNCTLSASEALGSSGVIEAAGSGELAPGRERVLATLERRPELRVVAHEHVDHRVVLHPVQALGRVDVR